MSTFEYRLGLSNLVADTFVPGVIFYPDQRELRMSWDNRRQPPRHDFPATLRGDGLWPKYGYNQRPSGGTGYRAMAQLIRYIRDLPRLPIETWRYWGGDSVKLCTPRTLELLESSDYANPGKTRCVLCGLFPLKSIDWWSLDRVTGPCCFGGRCIPEWYALPKDEPFRVWLSKHRKEKKLAA